jgi:hypothetical protein
VAAKSSACALDSYALLAYSLFDINPDHAFQVFLCWRGHFGPCISRVGAQKNSALRSNRQEYALVLPGVYPRRLRERRYRRQPKGTEANRDSSTQSRPQSVSHDNPFQCAGRPEDWPTRLFGRFS